MRGGGSDGLKQGSFETAKCPVKGYVHCILIAKRSLVALPSALLV